MEVYGYHPILKRKVEIGNSGVFRPEMLLPMVEKKIKKIKLNNKILKFLLKGTTKRC